MASRRSSRFLRASGDALRVPACAIDDYPASKIRGVHLCLPRREDIPFVKRLIRYVLAPMRMNTLFLEFAAGMRFDRRPEINEAWLRANRKAALGEWPPVPHGDMVNQRWLSHQGRGARPGRLCQVLWL